MTPDPTLTDEELAQEVEQLMEDTPGHTVVLFQIDVRHLIAALRASRSEVEQLQAEVDYCRVEHCG